MAAKIRIVFSILVLQLFMNIIHPVHAASLYERYDPESIREHDNHQMRKRSVATARAFTSAFFLNMVLIYRRIYDTVRVYLNSKRQTKIYKNNNYSNMKLAPKRMRSPFA